MEEIQVLEELKRCLQREIQGDLGTATQQGNNFQNLPKYKNI